MVTPAKSVIIVLGMYRSGISVMAGCLQILGADSVKAIKENGPAAEAGFDGNAEVVSIHDDLLRDLGFRWDMIGNLPDGWMDTSAADNAREKLMAFFQRDFSRSDVWVVSDPRIRPV